MHSISGKGPYWRKSEREKKDQKVSNMLNNYRMLTDSGDEHVRNKNYLLMTKEERKML